MILTRMVRTITATPTSPPGIIDTKKAKAFNNGLYKMVSQMLESIVPFYPEVKFLAKFTALGVGHQEFGCPTPGIT